MTPVSNSPNTFYMLTGEQLNAFGQQCADIAVKSIKEMLRQHSEMQIRPLYKKSEVAKKETITTDDLHGYIQIAHADPYVPSLPLSAVKRDELPDTARRIYVFERGSQMDLLSENPETFMWVSPIPTRLLTNLHLVQRKCCDNSRKYRDNNIVTYTESHIQKAVRQNGKTLNEQQFSVIVYKVTDVPGNKNDTI